ncbi:glycosyltransferase [Pontibacter sp. SGAir0037]|uniref:glycosyltransferase n=1 Tax=Pontibacter sp. SGAir0037 TaxID=2571030 RepID=UPI0010CCBEA1|nr:glycosyltransferase [Pontibacter sp. SGAir0037]QCR22159.1 hypothetical protein C1N53_07275 [Pontibacter sp. SGAir0037]
MKPLPKILIFIDWYLPGFKAGGPIQSCANLVAHLKAYFQFYIITRNTDYCSDIPYPGVASDSWNEVEGVQVYYLSKDKINYRNIKRLTAAVLADYIYINGIYSLNFSLIPLVVAKRLSHKHIIVAGRGMFAQSAVQVKATKKTLFFKIVRLLRLYQDVTFHATNPKEAQDIKGLLGSETNVWVAANMAKAVNAGSLSAREKKAGELKLVSIARISPEKNTLFALEVLSAYEGTGKICFDIYGPVYNIAYWEQCQRVIAKMPHNVSVRYKESLDRELVFETLKQYHVLFMPTQGENFGHIILESLTTGCPVIISDQTPWKNLHEKKVGYDIALTNHQSYIKAIEAFLGMEQEQYDQISANAFNCAISFIHDPTHIEANKALFKV